MPTNPVSPITEAAVDRLTLGVTSARGSETEPSICSPYFCFEAETSSAVFGSLCFEGE